MSFSTIEEHALAAVPAAEDLWWWQTFKKLLQHDWPELIIDQAFVRACVDAILNPACFSIGCLVATLAAIGCTASDDSLHTMSAVELREWIVSVLDAHSADQRRPDTDLCESRDVDWTYFVSCYVKEWTKRFPIVGLVVAQEHQHDQILVARRNGMTTLGLEVFSHGSKQVCRDDGHSLHSTFTSPRDLLKRHRGHAVCPKVRAMHSLLLAVQTSSEEILMISC